MRRLLLGVVLAGAATLGAPAARADAPVVVTQHSPLEDVSSWLCGFPVATSGSLEFVTSTFFDGSGSTVRVQMRVHGAGTYTGPTGSVADWSTVAVQTTDGATGNLTVTGTITHVVGRGAGVLLHDAGRIVEAPFWPPPILFEAGQHPTLEPDAWAPVCAFLAGS